MKDLTKTIIFTGKAGVLAFKWLSVHKNKSKYIIKLILEDMIISLEDELSVDEWNILNRSEIDRYFNSLIERLENRMNIDEYFRSREV